MSITTSKDAGGSVTVEYHYNFSVDGHEIKISNATYDLVNPVSFIYGDDGSTFLDLSRLEAEGNEMIHVVSAGNVDNLIPPGTWRTTGSIKIGSKVYSYVSSGGDAYFTLADNAVGGFALVDEGDSITVGKNQEINVYDEEKPYEKIINVSSGANYTVTKTKYNYTIALTESANLTIGETSLYFGISEATKETLANNPIVITLENDGTIISVDGLYNLTSTNDKLTVIGEDVDSEYGGLPVINSSGNLEYISVSDGNFTLTGGTNQTIEVSHNAIVYSLCENVKLIVGNVISNGNNNSLVSGTSDDDIISNYGSKVTINAGAGIDSIYNAGEFVTINGGTRNDSISNIGSNVSIDSGEGNNTIENSGGYSSIYSYEYEEFGEGMEWESEELSYSGSNVTIDAGKGKDFIRNSGNDSAIKAGDGNDSIDNSGGYTSSYSYEYQRVQGEAIERKSEELSYSGSKVSIDAGKGNDFIRNSGNDTAIEAGDGNDSIDNSGDYTSSYSREEQGDDWNVKREESYSGSKVSIDAGAGDDSISNSGNNVLLGGGAGNDTIFNSGYYVSESHDDIGSSYEDTYYKGFNVTINGGVGNDLISLGADVQNNLIEYTAGDGNDSIFGFNADETLSITGSSYSTQESGADILVKVGEGTITLKDVSANTDTININGETIELEKNITLTDSDDSLENYRNNVVINALGGNDSISNSGDSVTISSGAGNDTISLGGSTLIKYVEGDGNDLIQGFDEYDTLKIAGSSYSTKKSGDNIIVTVGKGKITLEGATYLDTLNIVSDKPSWMLDGTTAKYGTSDNTLVTVDGVKSLNGISLNKKVVTVKKASLGTSKVTVSDGYTLKLGSDVTKPSTQKAAWKLSGKTATYNQTTTAGYTLADNAITYNKKSTRTLATVKGVKSIRGLSVSGNVITVKKASLGTSNVTVSDGYTLKLGSDVTKPSTSKAAWKLSGKTATYNQTTTAGYTLADNAITYNKKATKTLATVKGVKSIRGLSVSGNVITVKKASLGTSNVTVSDGYTLKLGSDVTKPSTSKAAWKLSGSTATYSQTTTAGYTLADNAITYNKKSTKTLATVKGVKSSKGLSVSGNVITVSKASLSTSNVTVSDGYTLKLGSDVTKSSSKKTAWSLSGTTASYKQTTTAGYTLANDGKSVSYSKGTTAALASVKGAKSVKGLSVSDETITLKNSSLKNKVTVSGAYEFDFASDYKQATITGSANGDTITARGLKVSINGGNGNDTIKIFGSANIVTGGADNDYLDGSARNDKLYGGKGNDTLIGGKGNDSLWGESGADTFIYSSGDGKDVIFGFDNTDLLEITGDFSASYSRSKKEAYFKVGSTANAITLKDFSATSFNVNGDTYKISGSKLVKK